ncbi:hypothetical protein MMC22_011499 [Lobaria immixta]|nr:hypothetical protein [Lobaria immixta]
MSSNVAWSLLCQIADTYVALSYVWGGVDTLGTTKANKRMHQQPGMLSSNNADLSIPETIRDAMRLDTDLLCFPPGWSWNKDDLGGFWTNRQTPNQRFRYPIPSSAESPVSGRKRHGPLLFCIASRAWYFIGRQMEDIPVSRAAMSVSMIDMNGQWSGISRLSRASSRSAPVGTKCKLIAIFTGKKLEIRPRAMGRDGTAMEWDGLPSNGTSTKEPKNLRSTRFTTSSGSASRTTLSTGWLRAGWLKMSGRSRGFRRFKSRLAKRVRWLSTRTMPLGSVKWSGNSSVGNHNKIS